MYGATLRGFLVGRGAELSFQAPDRRPLLGSGFVGPSLVDESTYQLEQL